MRARIQLAVDLGMLAPGQRLPTPRESAEALEVSEMSVRRAYRLLADDGLVVSRRGNAGGTFIADRPPLAAGTAVAPAVTAYRSDAEHVHGLIDQRAALEAGLAALASGVRDPDQLDSLRDLVQRMRDAADWAEFRVADTAFHAVLAHASGLPAAAALHHRLSHELYAYFIPYRLDYLRASNEEHADLVDALERRDAGAAAALAFAHVHELHDSMYVGLSGEGQLREERIVDEQMTGEQIVEERIGE
ncbi:FadR/GntR family transcriptional regulator [Herbiconiux sp. P15]|uniref:FadR/GntR family transcriptional regulator n=1 Tax=Herbiconiux liukaitaii TaxID=3342799 RepID=UPI0035B980BC